MRNHKVTDCSMPRFDQTLAALADPTRRQLLRRLATEPCRAGVLAQGFAISRPAICKHTRLLTSAGLIKSRKEGRERIYELAPKGGDAVKEIIVELEEVERFWETALEAFRRYAEEKQ
jgi:DNA-binding transcriptional ArsR family regulator